MNDYAPSMDEIRAGWVMYSTWKRVPTCGRVQAEAEFDAALASELKKAREEALEEIFDNPLIPLVNKEWIRNPQGMTDAYAELRIERKDSRRLR